MLFGRAVKHIFRSRSNSGSRRRPPKISVVIAAYNHDQYIKETVHSIWQQEYENLEIIAADDNSSDDTFAILNDLSEQSPIPMVVIKNATNCGSAITFNRAAALASGDLLALFSSDDLFIRNRLELQAPILINEPKIEVVYGNGYWFDNITKRHSGAVHSPETIALLQKHPADIYEHILANKCGIFVQTALIRRGLYEAIGGCDENGLSDDWALNIRIFHHLAAKRKRHAFHNDFVFEYRAHEEQSWRNDERQLESKWKIIETYTPDKFKFDASNNIILSHINSRWHHLSIATRVSQLLRLARFQASLGECSSAIGLTNRILSLDPENEEAHILLSHQEAKTMTSSSRETTGICQQH
jgi:alpha-1,3-rhamnosyltransferase